MNKHEIAQVVLEWLLGDDLSAATLLDIHEETGMNLHPFEVGKCYFIEQQTLYYVGRVVEVGICWIKLEDCSWVHWTGRRSTLFRNQSFAHKGFPEGDRKPRTEYEGEKIIFTTSTSAAAPFHGELPKESLR